MPIATVLLAGGDGSRLGSKLPKGLVPFHNGETLFSLWIKKVQRYTKPFYAVIMVSSSSESQIKNYFSTAPFSVKILVQPNLPLLREGKESDLQAPSGNGEIYALLSREGLLEEWKKAGVTSIIINPIDNPLADPFDQEIIDQLNKCNYDLVVRGFPLRGEKAGRIHSCKEGIKIVEYIYEKSGQGVGYSGIFGASLSFFENATNVKLPLHHVIKNGFTKQERFIFDAFHVSKKHFVIIEESKKFFCPIKTKEDFDFANSLIF